MDQLNRDISEIVARGEALTSLPGIGAAISGVIKEILEAGNWQALDSRLNALPPELRELANFPRLDPVKVRRVYKKFGIENLDGLRAALAQGKLAELDRRTLFHLKQGLSPRKTILLWEADKIVRPLIAYLQSQPAVLKVSAAGAVRRRCETVDSIDLVVEAKTATPIFKALDGFGGLSRRTATSPRGFTEYELTTGVNGTVICYIRIYTT